MICRLSRAVLYWLRWLRGERQRSELHEIRLDEVLRKRWGIEDSCGGGPVG